jgi:hypothetical protein
MTNNKCPMHGNKRFNKRFDYCSRCWELAVKEAYDILWTNIKYGVPTIDEDSSEKEVVEWARWAETHQHE